jgi:hypothetical protein
LTGWARRTSGVDRADVGCAVARRCSWVAGVERGRPEKAGPQVV